MKVYLLLFFILAGCAQVTSISLKKHQYGLQPARVIWIQVAGLDDQLMAITKFSKKGVNQFENFSCTGSIWNYNLYKLRTSAYSGFHSQLVGSKNIKETCADYSSSPVWKKFKENGYDTAILEHPIKKSKSLLKVNNCKNQNFLDGATLFSMTKSKDKGAAFFHSGSNALFKEYSTYYDKSCQEGYCFSSLSSNAISIYERKFLNKPEHLFIIRDFSFEDAMLKRQGRNARKILEDINDLVRYFLDKQKKDMEMLVIVSGSAAIGVDMPKAGVPWKKFELGQSEVIYKNRRLNSPLYAVGARAENFCGFL
jgi:hypothetical protein